MRQLFLLRHGKSDWRHDLDDFDRPLKKRGRHAAKRMGIWLGENSCIPDCIISSPAERARHTALIVSGTLGRAEKTIVFDPRIYEASRNDLLTVLTDFQIKPKAVLLVGHNPGLENLLLYLQRGTLQRPEDGKLLPTASLAILRMPEDWRELQQGCAILQSITRATSLHD